MYLPHSFVPSWLLSVYFWLSLCTYHVCSYIDCCFHIFFLSSLCISWPLRRKFSIFMNLASVCPQPHKTRKQIIIMGHYDNGYESANRNTSYWTSIEPSSPTPLRYCPWHSPVPDNIDQFPPTQPRETSQVHDRREPSLPNTKRAGWNRSAENPLKEFSDRCSGTES